MRAADHTGKKFGRLVAIERVENDKWGGSRWLCLCECGKTKVAMGGNLGNGSTSSCGCKNVADHTGKRFGRLLVTKRVDNDDRGHSRWRCLCDCGNTSIVGQSCLSGGTTLSCGCRQYKSGENHYRWRGGPSSVRSRCVKSLKSSRRSAKKYGHKPCSISLDELIPTVVDKCEMCGVPEMELNLRLCMDHDHGSGAFRGWLCHRCNITVGYVEKCSVDVGEYLGRRSTGVIGYG